MEGPPAQVGELAGNGEQLDEPQAAGPKVDADRGQETLSSGSVGRRIADKIRRRTGPKLVAVDVRTNRADGKARAGASPSDPTKKGSLP